MGIRINQWVLGSSYSANNNIIISTDEDPSLRIESSAIINLRGVSTKLNKYIVFTMQTHKKLKFKHHIQKLQFLVILINATQLKSPFHVTVHILPPTSPGCTNFP